MMSGVVDPETLYTKQNCIGTCSRTDRLCYGVALLTLNKVVAVLARSTKGNFLPNPIWQDTKLWLTEF